MIEDPYFVATRSSRALNKTSHEVVLHVDDKLQRDSKPKQKPVDEPSDELDMKRARFEVYKFAQSGLPNTQKQKNQKELAMKLGAVPPKKEAINYKLYKMQLKKQKAKDEQAAELHQLGILHRPVRTFKTSKSRNPRAELRKKMSIGTGILKKYDKPVRKPR